jgi:hypothetical protein
MCQCGKSKIKSSSNVDHPNHYMKDTGFEVIDVIDAWKLDFNLGNAVKYIARAGKKNPEKTREDLEKAIWYISHKIKSL